jgi:hypothetical protein
MINYIRHEHGVLPAAMRTVVTDKKNKGEI